MEPEPAPSQSGSGRTGRRPLPQGLQLECGCHFGLFLCSKCEHASPQDALTPASVITWEGAAGLGWPRERFDARVLFAGQRLGIIYFQMRYFAEQENALAHVLCLVKPICHASVPRRWVSWRQTESFMCLSVLWSQEYSAAGLISLR